MKYNFKKFYVRLGVPHCKNILRNKRQKQYISFPLTFDVWECWWRILWLLKSLVKWNCGCKLGRRRRMLL